jgi:hypothetical protein
MMEGLLWILGSYGACVVAVHISHAWFRRCKGRGKPRHYVLITRNNEKQVEWYIRSLFMYSLLKGKEIKITIIDESSKDDTLAIVSRFAPHHLQVKSAGASYELEQLMERFTNEEVVFIPLGKQEDHRNIPLFQ